VDSTNIGTNDTANNDAGGAVVAVVPVWEPIADLSELAVGDHIQVHQSGDWQEAVVTRLTRRGVHYSLNNGGGVFVEKVPDAIRKKSD
jgi:sRNA-binding protein